MCSIQGLQISKVFCRLPLASGRDRIHTCSRVNMKFNNCFVYLFIHCHGFQDHKHSPVVCTYVHLFVFSMGSVLFYTRQFGHLANPFPFQEESKRTGLWSYYTCPSMRSISCVYVREQSVMLLQAFNQLWHEG